MLRNIISNEFLTALMLVCLYLVAAAKMLGAKRFEHFIILVLNDKYLKFYFRDRKFLDKLNILLFCNLLLSFSVFFFLFDRALNNSNKVPLDFIFKFIIAVGGFLLLKIITERILAYIFEIDEIIIQYIFQKISYKNYFGILLIPINTLLIYRLNTSLTVIYVIIFLAFIINLVGIMSYYKANLRLIKNNLFYFILYICTLEIAPYLFFCKVFFTK